MSFPRYERYKDSGVEWLGEVPEHWEIIKLSNVINKITNGYVGPTRDILIESGIRYLQSLHIKNNSIIFDDQYFVSETWSLNHSKSILECGDVLIVQTGDIGQVAVVTKEFAGCNCHALIIISPDKNIIFGEWISWLLNSEYGYHSLLSIQTGALHPHLNCGNVKDIFIPIPPKQDQLNIINSIEKETSKIDALIAEQQKLIELLKEKRQAVISHAVTKGLDPDVKMKDSGVEWLGEVPEHWDIVSLKHLVSKPIIDGPHETPVKYEDGIPFVSAEAISQGYINFDKIWGYISEEDHKRFSKRYKPELNDILVVKLGATTGTVALVSTTTEFNVWVPLAAIRVKINVSPKFIVYLLKSACVQDAIKLSWTYGTQQTLGLKTLENIPLPIPSLNEQDSIVDLIESKIPDIDDIINLNEVSISLLKERRTALISAAVTGKIDVRNLAPHPENEVTP